MSHVEIIKDNANTFNPNRELGEVIGWFATTFVPFGFYVYSLESWETEWLTNRGIDCTNVRRVCTDKRNTTLVRFNFEKGRVFFFDNEHYEATDEPKFQPYFMRAKKLKLTRDEYSKIEEFKIK